MQVGVTRAEPTQAGVVARMLHAFNTEFEAPVPTVAELEARFERLLGRDDVRVFLAHDEAPDAEPVGFALFTLRPSPYSDGPLAQLDELYVRPDHRGNGHGGRLMARALDDLAGLACFEIHINVDEVDTDARRFYERLGFTNTEPGTQDRMLCYVREM